MVLVAALRVGAWIYILPLRISAQACYFFGTQVEASRAEVVFTGINWVVS